MRNAQADVIVLKCCVCPYRVEFSSSDYHEGTQRATVNTRYVYAMRSIGRGAEAGRMFCALMNLPQPPTRFAPYNKRLLNAVKLVSEETMQKATQEAVLENGSNNNIAVAVDGTWQKRVRIPKVHYGDFGCSSKPINFTVECLRETKP
ncbi:uncharacterized protein NPIL_264971 [Nephila pilipes]|uniref:Mutator-like transposase domain-containing protein n=1 Tax=Nephila pilipes TaxID=299642 RepID=A0A8X6N141_NEPPI|nr:uncharacterized protein NPIL_689261 [Nephila pilipes]GFT45569.1 uncharacterized protein NPIL_275451 [Nephila pilipes]GFU15498.1 uncharacterized protein NPIL_141321 [Nephila pilipes]GFU19085.1 uncharacterized protein NPIL_264971 [Nephila pilipes]